MTPVLRRTFLALRDGGFGLAIPSESVLELAERREHARGELASLSASLGLAPSGPASGTRVIVVGRDGDRVAFAADEVLGVVEVEARDVLVMPDLVQRTSPALAALALVDGRSFVVVDTSRLAARASSGEANDA